VRLDNNLMALLQKMNLEPPPASLISGAYKGLLEILVGEQRAAFDYEYVRSQLDHQHANDTLYRCEIHQGSNPALKTYARDRLPGIDDRLHRVEALLAAEADTTDAR
jgi:putative membrane protein